jgi:hypothetical protein
LLQKSNIEISNLVVACERGETVSKGANMNLKSTQKDPKSATFGADFAIVFREIRKPNRRYTPRPEFRARGL